MDALRFSVLSFSLASGFFSLGGLTFIYLFLGASALSVLHMRVLATIAASIAFMAIRLNSIRRRDRFGLTKRESEIAGAPLGGRTNQEIADALYISRKTVENHLHSVFQKMGVANRVQLIGTRGLWRDEARV